MAKQKIDQTGNIEDGKILLKKLDNAEDKSLTGSGHMNESLIRKIGSGRKKKTIEKSMKLHLIVHLLNQFV
jgi:hypothetical protein